METLRRWGVGGRLAEAHICIVAGHGGTRAVESTDQPGMGKQDSFRNQTVWEDPLP